MNTIEEESSSKINDQTTNTKSSAGPQLSYSELNGNHQDNYDTYRDSDDDEEEDTNEFEEEEEDDEIEPNPSSTTVQKQLLTSVLSPAFKTTRFLTSNLVSYSTPTIHNLLKDVLIPEITKAYNEQAPTRIKDYTESFLLLPINDLIEVIAHTDSGKELQEALYKVVPLLHLFDSTPENDHKAQNISSFTTMLTQDTTRQLIFQLSTCLIKFLDAINTPQAQEFYNEKTLAKTYSAFVDFLSNSSTKKFVYDLATVLSKVIKVTSDKVTIEAIAKSTANILQILENEQYIYQPLRKNSRKQNNRKNQKKANAHSRKERAKFQKECIIEGEQYKLGAMKHSSSTRKAAKIKKRMTKRANEKMTRKKILRKQDKTTSPLLDDSGSLLSSLASNSVSSHQLNESLDVDALSFDDLPPESVDLKYSPSSNNPKVSPLNEISFFSDNTVKEHEQEDGKKSVKTKNTERNKTDIEDLDNAIPKRSKSPQEAAIHYDDINPKAKAKKNKNQSDLYEYILSSLTSSDAKLSFKNNEDEENDQLDSMKHFLHTLEKKLTEKRNSTVQSLLNTNKSTTDIETTSYQENETEGKKWYSRAAAASGIGNEQGQDTIHDILNKEKLSKTKKRKTIYRSHSNTTPHAVLSSSIGVGKESSNHRHLQTKDAPSVKSPLSAFFVRNLRKIQQNKKYAIAVIIICVILTIFLLALALWTFLGFYGLYHIYLSYSLVDSSETLLSPSPPAESTVMSNSVFQTSKSSDILSEGKTLSMDQKELLIRIIRDIESISQGKIELDNNEYDARLQDKEIQGQSTILSASLDENGDLIESIEESTHYSEKVMHTSSDVYTDSSITTEKEEEDIVNEVITNKLENYEDVCSNADKEKIKTV